MPNISLKHKRRYRVQISISKALWEAYNDNLELAKELGAEIDFTKDFAPWFAKQNEQARKMLLKMREEQQAESGSPTEGDGHADS